MQTTTTLLQAPHRLGSALRDLGVGLSMLIAAAAWAAPTVTYVATDLADVLGGPDLWRYDYSLSGPVDAFGSVNLLFSYGSYADLASSTGDLNLALVDVQPDAGLVADGIVIISPLAGLSTSDSTTLAVEFSWLGIGTPGSQPFEVVDGNGNPVQGAFRTILQGGGNNVPEPAALSLTLAALLALSVLRRSGRRP